MIDFMKIAYICMCSGLLNFHQEECIVDVRNVKILFRINMHNHEFIAQYYLILPANEKRSYHTPWLGPWFDSNVS